MVSDGLTSQSWWALSFLCWGGWKQSWCLALKQNYDSRSSGRPIDGIRNTPVGSKPVDFGKIWIKEEWVDTCPPTALIHKVLDEQELSRLRGLERLRKERCWLPCYCPDNAENLICFIQTIYLIQMNHSRIKGKDKLKCNFRHRRVVDAIVLSWFLWTCKYMTSLLQNYPDKMRKNVYIKFRQPIADSLSKWLSTSFRTWFEGSFLCSWIDKACFKISGGIWFHHLIVGFMISTIRMFADHEERSLVLSRTTRNILTRPRE